MIVSIKRERYAYLDILIAHIQEIFVLFAL